MVRRKTLAYHLAPVVKELAQSGELTFDPGSGRTNITIGYKGEDVPMKVVDGGWFTGIEMPDGSAIFSRREERENKRISPVT